MTSVVNYKPTFNFFMYVEISYYYLKNEEVNLKIEFLSFSGFGALDLFHKINFEFSQ